MTEAEWLNCDDPAILLTWLQRNEKHRPARHKIQQLANAFVNRCSDQLVDSVAIQTREFLDQLGERSFAHNEYLWAWGSFCQRLSGHEFGHLLVWALRTSGPNASIFTPERCARSVADSLCQILGDEERPRLSTILRDLFGNPFRPVTFFPQWRTSTVLAVTQQMYESRDFSAMPILADALQDAVCECAEVLTHCRDPKGIHVRGCWVVDLVLGKS